MSEKIDLKADLKADLRGDLKKEKVIRKDAHDQFCGSRLIPGE